MNHYKSGVATQIVLVILTLAVVGFAYAVLNDLLNSVNTFQTTYYGSGFFIQDFLTFVEQAWHWLPLFVVICVPVLWGLRQAQRRGVPPMEVEYDE